ncbi:probable L-type lectin-domain containing receptor kinase S.5 [Vigna radiata var. radiata]|uniref:non-specific serine/threonine protein kinase n=1 Tax=Vigna radiata var. radiata TaxID=3916 RepID=A0A1S3VR88_VIGRR|nr:probable L-type lectin-domain containing receptor kinase S.5 [Vigna radiata var. radiata]
MIPLQCNNMGGYSAAIAVITTILFLFPPPTSQAQILNTEDHVFGPFNQSYFNTFAVLPSAAINLEALQVTPDSTGNVSLTNRSGRIFFNTPFTLWNDENSLDEKPVSFNTSFLINVYRPKNDTPGEGITFFIAPSTSAPPPNSYGQFLGLTNASNDGNRTNQILAVELDTVKQDFDPDDNHLGLDVNGVRSIVTVPLTPLGFEIAPNVTRFHVLWVEYDGGRKVIDVYIAVQPDKDAPIVPKPAKPVLSSAIDLKQVVNRVSYFGFSASTGDNVELNCVLRWNISIEVFPKKKGIGNALKIGLGVGVPVVVLLVAGVVGWVYWLWRKQRESETEILGTLKSLPGTPREFRYQELKKATNNFDEKHKLGQGGYGVVYRGTLPKEKWEVAVKMFSRDKMKSTDDFLSELTIINRLRHKNLVRLLGWCHRNGVLLLVYDYMPNGSLDNHIFREEGSNTTALSWPLRYKIIAGVASALNYLHNEYDQKVVHRDLKASNIMLDSDFNARLGDFGLARALENDKTSYAELEGVHGTMGYIAPECFHTGRATRESDVYGFGAVVLEVVCGQRPWTKNEGYECLVDWVWHLHREQRILDAVDPRLGNDCVAEEAERILKLGLACSHPIASERPKMQTIVQIISGSVPVPHVPPFKPAFVWPAMDLSSLASDLTQTTTTEYTPMTTTEYTPMNSTTHSMHVDFSDSGSLV